MKLIFPVSFSESPIEEVTDALYSKWRGFMMTHNVELKMPDMIFDGATFRITPRAFEGDGALVKLEMIPRPLEEARTSGRFLLKKISKLLLSKCNRNIHFDRKRYRESENSIYVQPFYFQRNSSKINCCYRFWQLFWSLN